MARAIKSLGINSKELTNASKCSGSPVTVHDPSLPHAPRCLCSCTCWRALLLILVNKDDSKYVRTGRDRTRYASAPTLTRPGLPLTHGRNRCWRAPRQRPAHPPHLPAAP